ncbi:MAG: CCA tRNA nucleotidyltransferase [Thermoplasmata archaeon]|nr:CCA tRNA nucleotidyltransferase [Thermoplasmata archaeon]
MADATSDGPLPAARAREIETEQIRTLTPSPELLERVRAARERLVQLAEDHAKTRHSPLVRAVVAGSAARGTFLPDRLDIDLFLLFRPDLDRRTLEQEGMALATQIVEKPETRYAEHPYLRGTFAGFSVDAVPGYAIEDPSKPISAVDRTPFHHAFLTPRLSPAAIDQVRLTKQFLRAIRVYGSESRTQGFSGYLVELLIVKFGTLDALLADASNWRIPHRLLFLPEAAPRVPDDVALVIDDPVDRERNVATALSRRNFSVFVLAAQEYLLRPSDEFFRLHPPTVLAKAPALARIGARATHVGGLRLRRPDLVDDTLYPQLGKAERSLAREAERVGFSVIGTSSAAGPTGVTILIEVSHPRLAAVQLRDGPPPGIARSEPFLLKWTAPGAGTLQGPYAAEDGTLRVETPRGELALEPILTTSLPHLPIGKDLLKALQPTDHVQPLAEIPESPELSQALGELLEKRLPWLPARPSGSG